MKATRGALLLAAAVVGFVTPATADTYKNDRWGYKIVVPNDWREAAMSGSEEWIASKHLGKRALEAKRAEFWVSEFPEIWVIGFPHKRQEERSARIETEGDEAKIVFKNPYEDYKDFVKREKWFSGGYHFSEEEEDESDGVKVTKYEIKVEKITGSYGAPMRIMTWVYHFDDIDFAVQCTVLEDYYKKFRGSYLQTLRSFKRIERTRALPGAATTGSSIVKEKDERKMTAEEKKKYRQERFTQHLQRETNALPKDWYTMESEHYVALSNTDRKFTKTVLDHAEAVRIYLDKTFGEIGGDYVPPGIIRVFASSAEEQAYWKTTGSAWFGMGRQVLVSRSVGENKRWELEYVSGRLTDQYFSFKNELLDDNMPAWFATGINKHMMYARSKGKRIEIKPDEYDRDNIKTLIREEKYIPLKTLFSGAGEGADTQRQWEHRDQYGSVIGYLLTKGNRGKTKDIIKNYLANLIVVINEEQAKFEATIEKETKAIEEAAKAAQSQGESEDEENAEEDDAANKAFERMREAMKQKVNDIRARAFQATFGHLSERDWERLERAWLSWAG